MISPFRSICPKDDLLGFSRSFPLLAWLIMRPQVTLLLAACTALIFRLHSPVLALAPLCIWTALVALYLERRVIDRLLFPPFTAVTCWAVLGTGVGIPIMDWQIQNALRMTIYGVGDWHPALLTIQLVYLGSFPFMWIGYYYGGFRKVPQMTGSALLDGMTKIMQKKIVVMGWIFFLISVLMVVISVISGLANNRQGGGDVHEFNAVQSFLHLALAVAPKWGVLGFIFVPLLWKQGLLWQRLVVIMLLVVYFSMALVTGSRGDLMYPCCFMVAGAYFFRSSESWKTEAVLAMLSVIGITVVFAIYVYRNSTGYLTSSASDIPARYRAFRDSVLRPDPSKWRPETVFDFGYSFYGLEDAKVYALTPYPVPHTGFLGFSAIPVTWIPTTIVKKKPRLLDSDFVVGSYNNPPNQVIGTTISLTADTYRRFGWAGIPVIVLIAFGLYGALVRWMLTWWRHGTLWGWALLFFTMTFFWSRPFGTVLGTWWAFFYDTPKQLLATAVVCLLISKAVDLKFSRNRVHYDGEKSC